MRRKQFEIAEILLSLDCDLDVIEKITSVSPIEVLRNEIIKQNDKKHD